MKRIAVIGLAIALVLVPIMGLGCGSDENNDIGITTLPEGFTWYQNDEFGYKIAYPEDWDDIDAYSNDNPLHSLNINKYSTYSFASGEIPFDYYMANNAHIRVMIVSEYDISDLNDNAESREEVLINGRNGYSLILKSSYSIITEPSDYDDDLEMYTDKVINTVLEVNDKYYAIICRCPEEVWGEHAPIFDTTIRSFAIE